MSAASGLARKSMGARGLWFFAVSASAPMTVLAGGVLATLASTGVTGVPLAFLLLTAGLYVLTVGYVAMARYVEHAAPFYALLARGLGRSWGVAGGLVALLGYNAVQIALYGLIGATVSGALGGPWWIWAAVVWAVIGICGALRVDISGTLLSVLLMVEMAVIVVFDIAAFLHPGGGHISTAPLHPDHLFINGVGGVLALSVAAFVGYETGTAYVEEARTQGAVGKTTLWALAVLGPFYALSSWALIVAVGTTNVVHAAQTDPDLPFTVMSNTLGVFGPLISGIARVLLVTSIFAAMLSFHGTISRYTFAMAREKVLPAALMRTGSSRRAARNAPIGGSLLQSALAAIVVALFALAKADPVVVLFTWLAALSAVAVLVLLTAASGSAGLFFLNGGGPGRKELSAWSEKIAPSLGVVLGILGVGVTVWNLDTLLGVKSGSPMTYVIPMIVVVVALAGLVWAGYLRVRQPSVYDAIGRGRPHTLAMPDSRLNEVLR